ncbi:MAG: glycerol-3-phosphate 1-O-acyltransferase PlsY [Candidatus Brocadiaceae bacterium]|nr:glycerol-3-phosphate 1-O-acyltransferase PlsY [Candidatus Brocadiaceae bacterium]
MFILSILGPIISYVTGSIPFGFLITKAVKGIDIRQVGSGNPGATNVTRILGKPYGFLVFFLDMAKGFFPVFLFCHFSAEPKFSLPAILCGVGVIIGHTFPVFLGFKGGKAAATSCGVFLWLAPLPIFISAAIWLITVSLTRYVSLGSIFGSIAMVISVTFMGKDPFGQGLSLTLFSVFISVLLIIRHKSNIKRIIERTENKVGRKTTSQNDS